MQKGPAAFRVVLCHYPVRLGGSAAISPRYKPLFNGPNGIHLYLCGHQHYAASSLPGEVGGYHNTRQDGGTIVARKWCFSPLACNQGVRRDEYCIREVERHGARAMMWADKICDGKDAFLKRMTKGIVQLPWYYGTDFSKEKTTWDPSFETKKDWSIQRNLAASIGLFAEAKRKHYPFGC